MKMPNDAAARRLVMDIFDVVEKSRNLSLKGISSKSEAPTRFDIRTVSGHEISVIIEWNDPPELISSIEL